MYIINIYTLNEVQFPLNQLGLVMFLEEDHYVAQDFLYMLKLMEIQAGKLCPMCKVFAVGNHRELNVYEHTIADHVSEQKRMCGVLLMTYELSNWTIAENLII